MPHSDNHSLDTRCMKMSGVISLSCVENHQNFISRLFVFLSNAGLDSFYFIYHDETEVKHIHYLVILKRICRLKTFLNKLAEGLNMPSLAISIEKCSSVNSMLRYFLHIGERDKKLYIIDDIRSNMPVNFIDNLINSDDDSIDFSRLLTIVCESKTELEIMNKLGLKTYHKYRYEIRIMMEDRWNADKMYEEMMSNKTPF